ncbi:oligosaccharide flippase family protein [Flavimarina sp. Hel_I_48]|uniref:oligosaccharide flippase family protein n=1 Tax=Flavimarina sp. Hel_I_48 TaxID=1392488 RepID=UPI002934EB8A|nr:oligosaccharide flippase family protein [Flavimarina sp. Hel_I_48]
MITTYVGFAIGAVNTLFLYVNFFSQEYYGLVGFLLSTATILMPIMAFGTQNTLVKFYSKFDRKEQDSFLFLMLLLPFIPILPAILATIAGYSLIVEFLTSENPIVAPYIPLMFIIALVMAYFEIFYSWAKVQLQSVFGNFMNEVFHRLGVMALLLLVAFEIIDTHFFMYGLCGVYTLRMLIMMLYAFKLRKPVFTRPKLSGISPIVKYSVLIIIAGSIAVMILEIDMFMIGKMVPIENVAYYSVAIYIAAVIAVPARAMHQITYPLTAALLNKRDFKELRVLYQKSSLTLFVISGLIFVLIVCNIKQLYLLIDPAYADGLAVVLLISSAKLLDNLMGNNNAIIYNSDYYRLVLLLGVVLVAIAITLNLYFIPRLGINGAAIATFIASVGYAAAKIVLVYKKFNLQPFSNRSMWVAVMLLCFVVAFYFWDFDFYPVISIAIKSLLISTVYLLIVYFAKPSEEIVGFINSIVKKKSRPD